MKQSILMLGGICIDRYYLVNHFPVEGQDTLINETFERIGGCPINASFTIRKFGFNPILYSGIGLESENKITSFLKRNEFDESCVFLVPDQKSGFCTIILDEKKERTFMTYRGCEGLFDEGRIPVEFNDNLQHIYVTGLYLLYGEESEKVVEYLLKKAQQGCTVYFDPGPLAEWIDVELLKKVIQISTHLKVNEEEERLIKKQLKLNSLSVLFEKNCKSIVLTRGGRGSQLQIKDLCCDIAAIPIDLVDSNGAGDAFFAGYCASLMKELPELEAIKIAAACGSITAATLGPHADGPLEDILDLSHSFFQAH